MFCVDHIEAGLVNFTVVLAINVIQSTSRAYFPYFPAEFALRGIFHFILKLLTERDPLAKVLVFKSLSILNAILTMIKQKVRNLNTRYINTN